MNAYQRDCETRREVGGVRTNPSHWANISVHAFRHWLGESTLITHCDIEIDVARDGRQTTDLISCLQCGQASWLATQEWVRAIRWAIPRVTA